MAFEKRVALQHVIFTFDADSLGPERLKEGVRLDYIVGVWDTERDDPRPRDGVNAPAAMPLQKGFWDKDGRPQIVSKELTAIDGVLPADFAEKLNTAAMQQITDQAASIKLLNTQLDGARREIAALSELRDKMVEGNQKLIDDLNQKAVDMEKTANEQLRKLVSAAEDRATQAIAQADEMMRMQVTAIREDAENQVTAIRKSADVAASDVANRVAVIEQRLGINGSKS